MSLSRAVRPSRDGLCVANSSRMFMRQYSQDLLIKHQTGIPQVSRGPYGMGRNSVNGSVATVFGATGFLGRYIVSKLARSGSQIVIPYRNEDEKRHLKQLGDLGQVVPLEWSLRNEEQIAECVRHSDTIFNLLSREYSTKNFSIREVNVDGARRLAEFAKEAGASRFIHVSHLAADLNSPSEFLRAKAEGEDAVRRTFPNATIVRPGSIYGHEDRLLNKMAAWPITWKLNNGRTILRPVHSVDVAEALLQISRNDPLAMGQTFSLVGPKAYTVRQMLELVEAVTYQKLISPDINIPRALYRPIARLGEYIAWWPMFNADQVTRRFIDEPEPAPGTKTFADLGIEPDALEDVAIAFLRRFRTQIRYEQPISNARRGIVKLKQEPFRVIE